VDHVHVCLLSAHKSLIALLKELTSQEASQIIV
jgi:hypothetical protein